MTPPVQNIEDLDLPRSIIGRVIRGALPEGAQVQKDAKAAMVKACTVFINYLTATAMDVTKGSERKAISANDIFKALAMLEFEQFLPMIKVAVQEYQENAKKKRQIYKKTFKERQRDRLGVTDSADQPEDKDQGDEDDAEDSSVEVSDPSVPQKRRGRESASAIKRPRVEGNGSDDEDNVATDLDVHDNPADEEDAGSDVNDNDEDPMDH
ncbi:histone-fold-containing protein [Gaertneriomyces semiglobifer]|nr:histone-fold-containing protein [Gaertneriomyces semiglobifer]